MLNLLVPMLWALFKTRTELQMETLALREQLAMLKSQRTDPQI